MNFSALPVRLTTFLTLAMLLSFRPAAADDKDACAHGSDDEAIAACTRVINSGGWAGSSLVWAYHDRGNAYRNKGDNDRAIQDYDQAIGLDPNNAYPYNGRGIAYQRKGDNDRAMQDFDEAIRLDPDFAAPYNNRGVVYRMKGDTDRAIQDYDQAMRLDPKFVLPYNNRGIAYGKKGDNDRAIADFSQAIGLDPNYAAPYLGRGRLYFFGKAVDMAEADFKKASELNPKYAYGALWLDLTERRMDVPSHLAQAATQLDMTAWPAPVVRLYLGQMTPADVLDAAQNADAKKMKDQVCEANFYSGELALLQGKRDEATRLFRLAARECSANFVESAAATAELKGLGVSP
jgi:lipoprotein NlpI